MTSAFIPAAGFDFQYMLLEYYKKLGISEKELVTLFMIQHLLQQQNSMVTADMLIAKTHFKSDEADSLLSGLVSRGLVKYVPDTSNGKTVYRMSLEPLNAILSKRFSDDVTRKNQNLHDFQRSKDLDTLYSFIQKKWNKTLSPFDQQQINTFLDDGYRALQIQDAVEDCLLKGLKNFKSVGKRLREMRANDDIRKEGATAVSEDWDKDMEETMRILNVPWVPTDEE